MFGSECPADESCDFLQVAKVSLRPVCAFQDLMLLFIHVTSLYIIVLYYFV